MKINFATKTIEVTKTFATKASRHGSEEYSTLLNAMRDLPDFAVAVKDTPVRRRCSMKGLTYEHMESHIAMVDSDGTLLEEFRYVRQNGGYVVAKKWFLSKFSELYNLAA